MNEALRWNIILKREGLGVIDVSKRPKRKRGRKSVGKRHRRRAS